MKEKYIIITSINPPQFEFVEWLDKSKERDYGFIIKIIEKDKKIVKVDTPILNNDYIFEILDKNGSYLDIEMNHLTLSEIKYNYETYEISFILHHPPFVYLQKVRYKRTQHEIRNDIIDSLEKINLIPNTIGLETISYL